MFPKERSQAFPSHLLAAQFLPDGLDQRAAQLLRLIEQKHQHYSKRQPHGQILLAVPKIVFKPVALILYGVERLVLDLPATHDAALRSLRP